MKYLQNTFGRIIESLVAIGLFIFLLCVDTKSTTWNNLNYEAYIMADFLWVEKYRPKQISECILPEDIKTTFQNFLKQG